MYEAARVGDQIEHTAALAGFVVGALLGALVIGAAAFFCATALVPPMCFLTGLIIGAVVGMAADTVGRGIASLGEWIGSQFTSPQGPLVQGSHNVFVNNKPAIGAVFSHAVCKKHSGRPNSRVAEGSEIVAINNWPAGRAEDKLECGAKIAEGSDNVLIGGPPIAVLDIDDEVPQWVRDAAEVLYVVAGLVGGAAGAMKAAGKTGIKCFGKFLAGEALGYLGGELLSRGLGSLFGGPVDAVTGRKLITDETDLVVSAKFPIQISRSYDSDLQRESILGQGWQLSYELMLIEEADELLYYTRHGRALRFPKIPLLDKIYLTNEQLWVIHLSDDKYLIHNLQEEYYLLERLHEESSQFHLVRIENRQTEYIKLSYKTLKGHSVIDRIEDSSSNQLSFHYWVTPEQTRLTHIQQHFVGGAAEEMIRYSYDDCGQLAEVINLVGTVVRSFKYNQQGLMREHRHVSGKVCSYVWQSFTDHDRVIEHYDNSGQRFHFDYDLKMKQTVVTDALNHHAVLQYTEAGYITDYQDFDQLRYQFIYNDHDSLTQIILPSKLEVTFVLDTLERATEIYELDLVTKETRTILKRYAEESYRLTDFVSADKQNWKAFYNKLGQLTRTLSPLKHQKVYEYNAEHELIKIIDAAANEYRFEWDQRGNLIERTDCSGNTTYYHYNRYGDLTSERNALDQTVMYERSPEGRVMQIIFADNSSERFGYNSAGQLTDYIDPSGHRKHYSYDEVGRLTKERDRLNRELKLHYDVLGRIAQLVNQNGAAYTFQYDATGRILEEKRPDQTTLFYQYDERGFLHRYSVHGHHDERMDTTYVIDSFGQMRQRILSDCQYHYAYDLTGRLIQAQTLSEAHTNVQSLLDFNYDAEGRLVSEQAHLGTIHYQYDALGNLMEAVLPEGNRISYARYGAGYVHGILWNGRTVADFERNALHLETTRTLGKRTLTTSYNDLNQITRQHYADSTPAHPLDVTANNPFELHFSYNRQRELVKVTDSLRGTQRYEYDKEGRLTGHFSDHNAVHHPRGDYWERFVYDAADNLLDVDTTYADPEHIRHTLPPVMDNRLKTYKGTHYEYDAFGRMVERFDTKNRQKFQYNANNELIHAGGDYASEGFALSQVTVGGRIYEQQYEASYAYDALSRRIRKAVSLIDQEGQINGFKEETEFLWLGMQMVEARHMITSVHERLKAEGDTDYVPTTKSRTYTYIYQPDGDYEPLAQIKNYEEIAWYQNQINGAPSELVDEKGASLWAEHQGGLGQSRASLLEPDPDEDYFTSAYQPLRFQGQYFDHETRLHYNTFRYYDPHIGRFTTQDPIGLAGGFNLYQYAPNPIHWIDPWGWVKVYRNLRLDELIKNGLTAKLPGRGMTPAGHVRNGSNPTFKGSQYISTTTDLSVIEKYKQPGQTTVSFDTDDVIPDALGNKNIIDISTAEAAEAAGLKGPAKNYATSSKEVLVEGQVEPKNLTVC